MQDKVECLDRRPAPETAGHVEKRLHCLVYVATHIAVVLDDAAEEVIRQPAFPLGFDSVHDIVDCLEEMGLGELVDD